MGKKLKTSSSAQNDAPASFLLGGGSGAIDSTLSKLFENSSGPVQTPKYLSNTGPPQRDVKRGIETGGGRSGARHTGEDDMEDGNESPSDEDSDEEATTPEEMQIDSNIMDAPRHQQRKRKRGDDNDDLEQSYMRKVFDEEEKAQKKRSEERPRDSRKVVKDVGAPEDQNSTDSEQDDDDNDGDDISAPAHETLASGAEGNPFEKASRTVFLSNVSTDAITSKSAKKTLLFHLGSLFPSLSSKSPVTPKIESIRFRSTAFSSTKIPKRAAFAKQELMDTTTKSTNAYVVYSTVAAARSALQLNGTVVLDRHLRVDSVSNPAPVDHKRCVFVGNLDFVDEEADDADGEDQKRKRKNPPGDVEEGLWRTFCEHAPGDKKGQKSVESVRVVRDRLTRVGKGFAYVQFWDENCVEAALLLDGKKFPPLLPRKLRVTRAKRLPKASDRSSLGAGSNPNKTPLRALGSAASGKSAVNSNLLGRATAAKIRSSNKNGERGDGREASERMTVFEGHRATGNNGPGFKLKTKSRGAKKSGKPKNRSTRRAKAFRAGQKAQ